jgi:sugar phosphate isomerase/epimerase
VRARFWDEWGRSDEPAPGLPRPGYDPTWIHNRNVQAIEALLPTSEKIGVRLMVENVEGDDADNPRAGSGQTTHCWAALGTLDTPTSGHANPTHPRSLPSTQAVCFMYICRTTKASPTTTWQIGAGVIDWKRELRTLKATGYNGTITLECFYGDTETAPVCL